MMANLRYKSILLKLNCRMGVGVSTQPDPLREPCGNNEYNIDDNETDFEQGEYVFESSLKAFYAADGNPDYIETFSETLEPTSCNRVMGKRQISHKMEETKLFLEDLKCRFSRQFLRKKYSSVKGKE
jgi:hypothetical protein